MYQELQAVVCYLYEQVKEKAQGHSAQEKVRALSVIQPFKTPIHAHICTHESLFSSNILRKKYRTIILLSNSPKGITKANEFKLEKSQRHNMRTF